MGPTMSRQGVLSLDVNRVHVAVALRRNLGPFDFSKTIHAVNSRTISKRRNCHAETQKASTSACTRTYREQGGSTESACHPVCVSQFWQYVHLPKRRCHSRQRIRHRVQLCGDVGRATEAGQILQEERSRNLRNAVSICAAIARPDALGPTTGTVEMALARRPASRLGA